jgi:glycosyl transferase, family 25
MTLAEAFDAVFVINLPERKDRLRAAQAEFDRVGWYNVVVYPAVRFRDAAGFLSPAWRGCFHSHLSCLRIANDAGLKNVLVLEDDIALSPALPNLTPGLLEAIKSLNWDFLYFGHHKTGDIPHAGADTRSVSFVPLTADCLCTHFYAVNSRIIPRLIAHMERCARGTPGDQEFGPMPLDGAFNVFRRHNKDVKTYLANPKLGWQRPSRSDIAPRGLDQFPGLAPLMTIARAIKSRIIT